MKSVPRFRCFLLPYPLDRLSPFLVRVCGPQNGSITAGVNRCVLTPEFSADRKRPSPYRIRLHTNGNYVTGGRGTATSSG